MAIYGWSDIHVDFPQNMRLIESLPREIYSEDSIIIAGDVASRLDQVKHCLSSLKNCFAEVFYLPGNHDLWLYKQDFDCSIKKFHYLLTMCQQLGVHTTPQKIALADDASAWVVPLYSWYSKPEWGDDSLFIKKLGEDPELKMWADNYRTRWPSLNGANPAVYFMELNQPRVTQFYDVPVISFSHFLPSRELIFPGDMSIDQMPMDLIEPYPNDPHPEFNFTRVAGTSFLQQQIDQLPSHLHFYGHQHRNKKRKIAGKTYVSHCMGYPQETRMGPTGDKHKPMKLWPL